MSQKPLLPWDSSDDYPLNLVWKCRMDKRYILEVHRAGEDNYHGKLYIFDHNKNDLEIACWDVSLSYGAVHGADVEDQSEWCKKAEEFIDNVYNKQ